MFISDIDRTNWLIDRTGSFNAPFFLAPVGLAGVVVYLVYASGVREIA